MTALMSSLMTNFGGYIYRHHDGRRQTDALHAGLSSLASSLPHSGHRVHLFVAMTQHFLAIQQQGVSLRYPASSLPHSGHRVCLTAVVTQHLAVQQQGECLTAAMTQHLDGQQQGVSLQP